MANIFQTMKNVFTYKPEKGQAFELLEGSTEGVERENTPEAANLKPGSDTSDKTEGTSAEQTKDIPAEKNGKKVREKKTPLTVEEWNKQKNDEEASPDQTEEGLVSSDLSANLQKIKKEFGIPYNTDVMTRKFKIARKVNAFITYVDGMVDSTFVSDFVLRQLMEPRNFEEFFKEGNTENISDYINENVISVHEVGKMKDLNTIYFQILCGDTALFIDGAEMCLIISTRGYEKRSVEKPVTENVVMGSQEGFTENLRTNLTLVRKIIKNKNLITEMIKVGKTNQAYIGIMYMNGIVNQEVIKEVKRRLNSIDAAFVAGDGMVGQFIEDSPFMIFPQTLTTERPDRVASFLMEGKVAIISEGAPFAEVVPITFYHLLQTSEDSMVRWQYGSFLRIIRVFGIMVSAFLPAMYVALTLFHQEMIPTELLASIARSKEEVPFPTIVEIILLEISFELIREGGIRIPGVIGQTLGIIGALILGQAAVAAGLVSPILIIIVAVTGLGSFAIPNYPFGLSLRVVRFFFTFMAAILGFYGISLGLFLMACVACNIKSFGVPFFAPVAPKTKSAPDLVMRQPIWKQEERPDFLNPANRRKQSSNSRGWEHKKNGGKKQ
ncbi:MAG: spore germination protein [Clostridia bacterium]|nr:spore germination protein [Clostridia bacterium]